MPAFMRFPYFRGSIVAQKVTFTVAAEDTLQLLVSLM